MTSNNRLPSSLFAFLVLLGVIQARQFAKGMPPVLATHFGGNGLPNGWQSQSQFFTLEIVLLGVCLLLAFGIPWLISVLPTSLVNIPNKEYWLAPQRRERTLAFFRAQFAWFGCAFLALLIVVNQLVFNANQAQPRQLNSGAFVLTMVAFLAFVGIWTARLIVRLSRKTNASDQI